MTGDPARGLARPGRVALAGIGTARYFAALLWCVSARAVSPRRWRRTVRRVLARQIYFSGVQALGLVSVVAVLVGISIVLQAGLWLDEVGQSLLVGPLLVAVVVREIAPLVVNVLVLIRSGSAIATELGTMAVSDEVAQLEAQGIDPIDYLVVPRVAGVVIAVVCLSVFFGVLSFASGYASSLALEENPQGPLEFLDSILIAIGPLDVANVLAKTVLGGLAIGVICCADGLSVGAARTEIPKATTRALSRSILCLFFLSAAISIVSYALL